MSEDEMAEIAGLVLVLLAVLGVAGTTLLIRIGTANGQVSDALVVVLMINVVTIVPYTVIRFYPDYRLTLTSLLAFIAAGMAGTLLGRASFYAGIERIGASRAEPIKASMPLHASIVAVVVLGETLTYGRFAGIVLITVGVALVSWESASRSVGDESVGILSAGLIFPLTAAFFYGIEPTFAKIGLEEGTPVLVGLGIKTLAATIGFVGYLRIRGALPQGLWSSANTKWYVAAGLANTGFLVVYYSALRIEPVVLVVPVMQTSPLIVIAMSYLFLRRLERPNWRLAGAATITVLGAIAVTVLG